MRTTQLSAGGCCSSGKAREPGMSNTAVRFTSSRELVSEIRELSLYDNGSKLISSVGCTSAP